MNTNTEIQEKLDNFLEKINEIIKNKENNIDTSSLSLSVSKDKNTIANELNKCRNELNYIEYKLPEKKKNCDNAYVFDYILEKLKLEFDIPDYMIYIIQETIVNIVLENLINGIDYATSEYTKLNRSITKNDYEYIMQKLFTINNIIK